MASFGKGTSVRSGGWWQPLAPLVVSALFALGCNRSESAASTSTASASSTAPALPSGFTTPAGSDTAPSVPLVLARGVRFVKAGTGDVPTIVRAEREKAAQDGRQLLVYVGATWCEPCQRFHHAAQRGDLDGDFPDLTILEFDLDEDRDRVRDAGYSSKLIPLFVLPGPDGRASRRRFEGGPKGDRAVTEISARLRRLLAM